MNVISKKKTILSLILLIIGVLLIILSSWGSAKLSSVNQQESGNSEVDITGSVSYIR